MGKHTAREGTTMRDNMTKNKGIEQYLHNRYLGRRETPGKTAEPNLTSNQIAHQGTPHT